MAEYVTELRMELIRSHIVNDELLPPILPIVLYNGVSRWTASKTLNSIQVALPEPLALPDTKEEYVLIDIHRLVEESLQGEKVIPSAFFLMERANGWAELQPILQDICGHFCSVSACGPAPL